MKCKSCGQEIIKQSISKDNWIWIPELKVYIEKDVHHKNYSYNQLKEIYGKGFEKMLLTKSQVEFLRDHSEYSRIFKLKTWTNDFFIQQFSEEDKKAGYVADFFVYGYGSVFYSFWGSSDAYNFRGVRFCRKKIKDTQSPSTNQTLQKERGDALGSKSTCSADLNKLKTKDTAQKAKGCGKEYEVNDMLDVDSIKRCGWYGFLCPSCRGKGE